MAQLVMQLHTGIGFISCLLNLVFIHLMGNYKKTCQKCVLTFKACMKLKAVPQTLISYYKYSISCLFNINTNIII